APRKAKAVDGADAEAVGGLYAEIFASGTSLDDIVGDWLKRFDAHEYAALAEVINFVLRCAGCESEVDEHDTEDVDGVHTKLDDLRDEYQATNPTEYPLIAKGKGAAGFRQRMVGFFDSLIQASAIKGTLFENGIFMENVLTWLSTMSSAPNRSFRHTATLISLSIVTALCEVARENAKSAADSRSQAEKERSKSN
ncbi:cohesin complex subunit, partial [Teratosphaeriaceae sp. CCFEE 6253]